MTQENNIRQTSRELLIIGKLKSKKLTVKKDEDSGLNRLSASAEFVIVVNTKYGESEIKVWANPKSLTNSGEQNKSYDALIKSCNTLVSYEETMDINAADLVKVKGTYEDGTFYSVNSDDFIEKGFLKAGFIYKINRTSSTGLTNEDTSKVGFEGVITSIEPTEDEELKIKMVGIGYQGVAVPIEGFVPKDLVAAFQSRYYVGQTTTLIFMLTKSVVTKKSEEEVCFGEGLGDVIEKETVKNIIIGGLGINEAGYTEDQVRQALALREVNLEKKKENALKKAANGGANNGAMGVPNGSFGAPQGGFGAPQGGTPGNIITPQGGFGAPTSGFGVPAGTGAVGSFGAPVGGFGQ